MTYDADLLKKYLLAHHERFLPLWFSTGVYSGAKFSTHDYVVDTRTGRWAFENGDDGGTDLLSLYEARRFFSPGLKEKLWGEEEIEIERFAKFLAAESQVSNVAAAAAAADKFLQAIKPKRDLDAIYPSLRNGFYIEIEGPKGGISEIPQYEEMAQYLMTEIGFQAQAGSGYIFNGKCYEYLTDADLEQIIDRLLQHRRSQGIMASFRRALLVKGNRKPQDFVSPQGYLNCANGVLNVETRKLTPHSKDVYFDYVLPHPYEEGATCEKWEGFLNFVFQKNEKMAQLSAEIFGYIIQGGKPWLAKSFILYGDGRNGKSTWLDVLSDLIGETNQSAAPIQLWDRPFTAIQLKGKMANVLGELSQGHAESGVFKAVVAGDKITGAYKGKDEINFKPTARCIFAANDFPVFKDPTPGLIERLTIMPFDLYIPLKKRDPKALAGYLSEMPGILNWALDGLDRLLERGWLLQVDEVTEKLREYRMETDTVFRYVEEHFEWTDDPAKFTPEQPVGSYYIFYETWCRGEGAIPKRKSSFSRILCRELRLRFNTSDFHGEMHRIGEMPRMHFDKDRGNKVTVKGRFIMTHHPQRTDSTNDSKVSNFDMHRMNRMNR